MKRARQKRSICSLVCGLVVVLSPARMLHADAASKGNLETVERVDLKRYSGTWYEIMRLPLYWEKKCADSVTANYEVRGDGKIAVTNRCRKADGEESVSKGTAVLADSKGPASKLKVTFFWPFTGDYWILDLDPEYRWALVGTPDRKYLWILSRTPRMNEETVDHLLAEARTRGFDTSKMISTKEGP